MDNMRLGAVEGKFADLIWENEPLRSVELVKLAAQALGWKKPTTYTVLRRLCQRGIFQNQEGIVSSLLSRQDFFALRSEQFIEENFSGSLPAFLAAFTARKKLSEEEIADLQSLIDRSRG